MSKFDVTTNKRSIAGQLEEFIAVMEKHTLEEIKTKVKAVLESDDTVAHRHTRKKWLLDLEKQKTKPRMMNMITNLYLAAAQLKVE